MSKLYLIHGIPGSGKTSFCNKILANIAHFENDQYFYHNDKYEYDKSKMKNAIDFCLKNVENYLKHGIDVCVSNTFTKKKFIDTYKKLAETYNADFIVIKMMGNFKNIHNVPESIMNSMKSNFEDYENEIYAYPNLNQDSDDPCYRPYIFTNIKVGDKILVDRFSDHKDIHTLIMNENGISGDSFEMEKCEATVTKIVQGTYDYLNIHYVENDTKKYGICMNGSCKKV